MGSAACTTRARPPAAPGLMKAMPRAWHAYVTRTSGRNADDAGTRARVPRRVACARELAHYMYAEVGPDGLLEQHLHLVAYVNRYRDIGLIR